MPLLSARPSRRRRWIPAVGLALACLLAALAASSPARAGPAPGGRPVKEYDLKAAFLFNFAQFVEWPSEAFPSADAPIIIGVLGDDPFGESLDEIVANEAVRNRRLVIKRFHSVEEIGPCHILFISPTESTSLSRVLASLRHRSILTVGETPDFATRSGMIGFVVSNKRLKLRINLAATRAAQLTISSKLLRQAQIVHGSGETASE